MLAIQRFLARRSRPGSAGPAPRGSRRAPCLWRTRHTRRVSTRPPSTPSYTRFAPAFLEANALDALAHLALGHFSADGRIFCDPAIASGGGPPDACLPLRAPSDPGALTLFFRGLAVVAICPSHSVLARPTPRLRPGCASFGLERRAASYLTTSASRSLRVGTSCRSTWPRRSGTGVSAPSTRLRPRWRRAAWSCPSPGSPFNTLVG
jgi:hypothetical protein